MKPETFKDIKGYEGYYQVSNLGNIKSFRRGEKLMKPTKNSRGYMLVDLNVNKDRKSTTVHRLVAETFLPNVANKKQINHIDGNKSNNVLDNLEWCSCSENQKHAFRTGLRKSHVGCNNPNWGGVQ